MQKTTAPKTGFFVDWNGATRRIESPGAGMRCEVVPETLYGVPYFSVNVIDQDDFVTYEATYFETLEAVQAAGGTIDLIEES